jgi:hypothetical protein
MRLQHQCQRDDSRNAGRSTCDQPWPPWWRSVWDCTDIPSKPCHFVAKALDAHHSGLMID